MLKKLLVAFVISLGVIVPLIPQSGEPRPLSQYPEILTHTNLIRNIQINEFENVTAPIEAYALQNGAIRSEAKELYGTEWIITGRYVSTYQNGLLMKYADQYLPANGVPSFSSVSYLYNSSGKISKAIINHNSIIIYYNYDGAGRLIEDISKTVDGMNLNRNLRTYDANGYHIETLSQNWQSNQWNNTSRITYVNNANGYMIERIRYYWNGNDWSLQQKYLYTNNSLGSPTEIIYQNWISGQWTNSAKANYTRNSNNLVTQYVYYYWISNSFEIQYKQELTYTTNNDPLLNTTYNWVNNSWIESARESFTVVNAPDIFVILPLPDSYYYSLDIHWAAIGINNVDIQFSSNNGNTWTTIATGLPDTGNCRYTYSITSGNFINSCKVRVLNSANNSIYDESFKSFTLLTENVTVAPQFYFDANKIKLPVNNKGIIGDVNISPYGSGGTYDDIVFLFSGGFYMSGYTNGTLWANGVLSASLVEDYIAGQVTGQNVNPYIYTGKSSSVPFGASWNAWIDAVSLGASFYDGNNDGIYNPVDLNNNGTWDSNEDRPDFLANLSAWCVFNDGVPAVQRRLGSEPQGIEVKQTVFAPSSIQSETQNVVFVRYRLQNAGNITSKFESVYFSVALDPDLGNQGDDLVGCDTLRSAGFCYQTTADAVFGANPPVFLVKILQGPHVFIDGVTYNDLNANGVYDHGTDIPLDTAYERNGPYIGVKTIPGAKNLDLSSFGHYLNSDPNMGDANNPIELRNYLTGGLMKNGSPLDPCVYSYGNGNLLPNCFQINPKFMFSGNPLLSSGWLNTSSADQRMLLNMGTFNLESGKPIDIIAAYVMGRGNSPLASLDVAKQNALWAEEYYNSNFPVLPTSVDDQDNKLPEDYTLNQNYPNPFNPVTVISYQIPQSERISLKVFDILGNEIITLIDEVKEAGTHKVIFNGSKLSSGVYFYSLTGGKKTLVKKMLLIK